MRDRICVLCLLACWILATTTAAVPQAVIPTGDTSDGWTNPPNEARLRAYWWWLNGNVDKASITRDLEEMKAKGFGGALLCDAGVASQGGNSGVPAGPTFFSDPWRELYRHCLSEAHRLGLEISLNIQSGWNVGGPMVRPEDVVKKLVWSEAIVQGPGRQDIYGHGWRVHPGLPAQDLPGRTLLPVQLQHFRFARRLCGL